MRIYFAPVLFLATVFAFNAACPAATDPSVADPEFDQILSLDIADLTVTSVSKREQKLNDTASAIYVITQEDLLRTGSTSIPEALRMVPGLEVARVSGNQWAITARGFNGVLANKLLVLIDGRTVYTPVFSGTYWDDQSTPVQDIDRIEVIRGPGASIWGANAVDGVINIITKNAKETQGNYAYLVSNLKGNFAEARHGGKIDDNTYYRSYAEYQNSPSSHNTSGISNNDGWYRARSGFKVDGDLSHGDSYTVQGDVYGGNQDQRTTVLNPTAPFSEIETNNSDSYGGNVLGRWNHQISKDSQLSLQAYIDHYSRVEITANQHVTTGDVELQHSVKLDDRNNFIWGTGVRVYQEDVLGSFTTSFEHPETTHEILSAFAQNEYALVPKKVFLTVGSKFEYNDYTGFEIEPTARLSWHITDNQMVWGAISRAVRTPSSLDEDISAAAQILPTAPATELRLLGNPDQQSEDLIAYELGHRIQVTRDLQFDTSLFYNDFNHLETISNPGTPFTGTDGNTIVPFTINNLGSGHAYGAEVASSWNVNSRWRLTGSYTFLKMSLQSSPGAFGTLDSTQDLAPRNQFSARSYFNVSDTVHWDNMLYYVDKISGADAYVRYDTRLAWLALQGVEVSVIGRNLIGPSHVEFPTTPVTSEDEIGRAFVGQLLLRF